MGPLFNILWVNTATLLTQIGENPIVSRKVSRQDFASEGFHWGN